MTTLDGWLSSAIAFSLDDSARFNAAVDALIARLGDFDLLGIGEPLHGGEEFLILRNRLFQRLAEAHGFSSIAVESSYTHGLALEDFVAGAPGVSYDRVKDFGFTHSYGVVEANCELLEWMRGANTARDAKLRFYGMDAPMEAYLTYGSRPIIMFALDYFTAHNPAVGARYRDKIIPLLGDDAAWENTEANFDPSKAIGRTPAASALRIAVEDLALEFAVLRRELVGASGEANFREAAHHIAIARDLLSYHASIADGRPVSDYLTIRDAIAANNVAHILEREAGRGKVLLFAHSAHLQRAKKDGPFSFWPVGAHLAARFGDRYKVIGGALGHSVPNGVAAPEGGTLEDCMLRRGESCFLLAHEAPTEARTLALRSGSTWNRSYSELTPASFSDFDAFAFLPRATYTRGAPAPP